MSPEPTKTQTSLAVSIRTLGQDLAAIQKGQTPTPRVETVVAGPPETLPVEQFARPQPAAPKPTISRPPVPPKPAAPSQLESVLAPSAQLQKPPAPPAQIPTAPKPGAPPVPAPPKPLIPSAPQAQLAVSSVLKARIQADLQEATKRQDTLVTSVLRLLLSAIHNAEISQHKEAIGLNDNEIRAVIASEVQRRKEAIAGYERGGRGELVEKERTELAALYHYLPTPSIPPAGLRLPTAPLTQPVKPAFSPPPQPSHPTIPPPVAPPAPKTPTPVATPARPQVPAAAANRRKLVFLVSSLAVVVLAAAGGTLWWFKFRPTTVTPPPPPPIVEPTEPTPIVASVAALKAEASTPAGIPAAVTSAWTNQGRGGAFDVAFVKIVMPDGARRYATAANIIASYPLNIPAAISQDIADINLIRFTQTEFLTPSKESLPPDRFAVAIKFTVAPSPGTIAAWENMIAPDLEPYLGLSRFNAELDVSSWKDSTHRGIAIRYMNFALPDQSFDYAFLPAQNLLLITTSRESMYALIDLVLNQNSIK